MFTHREHNSKTFTQKNSTSFLPGEHKISQSMYYVTVISLLHISPSIFLFNSLKISFHPFRFDNFFPWKLTTILLIADLPIQ